MTILTANKHQRRWQQNLNDYTWFIAEHDRRPAPSATDTDELRLASWARRQRKARRDGTLEKNRETELERVPGWTWGRHRAKH